MSRWRRKSEEDDQDADAVARWDAFQNMLGAAQESGADADRTDDVPPAPDPAYGGAQSPWTSPPPAPWGPPQADAPPPVSWQVPGPEVPLPDRSAVPPWRVQPGAPPPVTPAVEQDQSGDGAASEAAPAQVDPPTDAPATNGVAAGSVAAPAFLSELSDLSEASWTSISISLPGDAERSRGNDPEATPSGNGASAEADEAPPSAADDDSPKAEAAVDDETPASEPPAVEASDEPAAESTRQDVPSSSGQQPAAPPQQWQSAPVAEPAYGWSPQPPQPRSGQPTGQQPGQNPGQPLPPPGPPGWQHNPPPPYPPQQPPWQAPGWQQPGPQQWPAPPPQGPPPQQRPPIQPGPPQPQQPPAAPPPQRQAEPQPPETPPFVWTDQFQKGQRTGPPSRRAPQTGGQPAAPPQPPAQAGPQQPAGLTPYQLAGPPSPAPTRPTASPDDLSADALIGRRARNSGGWRKAVSGISVRPGHARAEQRRRELIAQATVPVHGCYRIAVISLKGGVGKTISTVCIGATLASLRGDRVIAVDANPDRGTLSGKIPLQTTATVRNLLNDADHIQTYSDVRRYTSQSPDRLEILASESDPSVSLAFGEDDYRRVAGVLERFYNVVLTDCGTGLLHSAMAGVLSLADQIVVVSSGSVDGARSASATLDWLEAHGYSQLVAGGLAVINSVRPRSGGVNLDALESHFAARCRSVTRIPYDSHLELGAEVDLAELHQSTRDALLELAAQVAAGFPGQRLPGFGPNRPQPYAPAESYAPAEPYPGLQPFAAPTPQHDPSQQYGQAQQYGHAPQPYPGPRQEPTQQNESADRSGEE